jgi:hypothetical protein
MKLSMQKFSVGTWSLVCYLSHVLIYVHADVSLGIHRELETRVAAHAWPTTIDSVYCEAWAYHAARGRTSGQEWLQNIVQNVTTSTTNDYAVALASVLQASPLSSSSDSTTSRALLTLSLSLRAYSPLCELQRTLARKTLLQTRHLASFSHDAFVVVYPAGHVIVDNVHAILSHPLSLVHSRQNDTDPNDDFKNLTDSLLLPDEIVWGPALETSNTLVILYANLGTPTFGQIYPALVQANVSFVIRHLGAVHYEEQPTTAQATYLQGYGVRLDIRNVEYKVFDDRINKQLEEATVPPTNSSESWRFLAGINVTRLLENVSSTENLSSVVTTLQQQLAVQQEAHALQAQLVPPRWQRRQLPLQATTVILDSPDPLVALQDISHNLPSRASTLVHIKIPESYLNLTASRESNPRYTPGRMYLNGLAYAWDRPTLNVFQFWQVLHNEQDRLDQLQEQLRHYIDRPGLEVVRRAWSMGSQFWQKSEAVSATEPAQATAADATYRVDVGRGGRTVIRYLNDLEKDAAYRSWPRSVRQMLMSLQFGMPPMVRRNLFTLLAVLDPTNPAKRRTPHPGLTLGLELIQSSFPIRIGVLIVSESEVAECAAWLSSIAHQPSSSDDAKDPCPVNPLIPHAPSLPPTRAQLTQWPASAQAVHRLVEHFATEHSEGGATMAYVEYIMTELGQQREEVVWTLDDLVKLHGTIVMGMGLQRADEGEAEAYEVLTTPNKDYTERYGRALRFAAEKKIRPNMSFLNGRPLPEEATEDDESLGKALQEEQQYIFGMIVNGKITDNLPRSVYAHVLKGDNVFKSAHPLLFGSNDKGNAYVLVDHNFGPESILSSITAEDADAAFLLEALVDWHTPDGLQSVLKLLSVMSTYAERKKDAEKLVAEYRILPRTKAAAQYALCPIMSHASALGATALKDIVSAFMANSTISIEEALQKGSAVSTDLKQKITDSIENGPCVTSPYLTSGYDVLPQESVIGNGRVYSLDINHLSWEDVDLLQDIEEKRTKVIVQSLAPHINSQNPLWLDAISRVSAFLNVEGSKTRFDLVKYNDTQNGADNATENDPFQLSWNTEIDSKLKVTTIFDICNASIICQVENSLNVGTDTCGCSN